MKDATTPPPHLAWKYANFLKDCNTFFLVRRGCFTCSRHRTGANIVFPVDLDKEILNICLRIKTVRCLAHIERTTVCVHIWECARECVQECQKAYWRKAIGGVRGWLEQGGSLHQDINFAYPTSNGLAHSQEQNFITEVFSKKRKASDTKCQLRNKTWKSKKNLDPLVLRFYFTQKMLLKGYAKNWPIWRYSSDSKIYLYNSLWYCTVPKKKVQKMEINRVRFINKYELTMIFVNYRKESEKEKIITRERITKTKRSLKDDQQE